MSSFYYWIQHNAVAYPLRYVVSNSICVQQIHLRAEGRENGDLWVVTPPPPNQEFRSICKWVKTIFLLGCYGCICHGTGNSAQLCQNFGIWGRGGLNPQPLLNITLT
jgi:hypothetical protein